MTVAEDFNVEDFLNFNIAEQSQSSIEETPSDASLTLWDAYPPLWRDSEPIETPLFHFEDATLMDEEYEDPLAVLLKKAPTKLEFREKQKERRLKLDMLAQNLTQKDSVKSRLGWAVERPSMDCKQGLVSVISLLGHSRHSWTRDPNSVQVHSMFDLSSPNLKSYYDDKVCPPVHDTPMDLYIRSTQLYQSVTQKSPVPSTCTSQEKDLVHSIYPLFKSLLPEIFVPSMP